MAKPLVSLRKPPSSVPDVEAFIRGGERSAEAPSAPASQVARASGSQRGLLERSGGRVTRRMTAYVAPELAKRLSVFCASEGRQVSEVIEEALAGYLGGQAAR